MHRSHLNNLYIVIPVHNRILFTRECLLSLRHQTRNDFSTIIVDDGSTDGTSEMTRADFPETVILRGDGNLWWTAATNLGVEYALARGATHIMTLNDDTVAVPDFIERMLDWTERAPGALLGALAIDAETGYPIYGGERIDWSAVTAVQLLDILPEEDRCGLHAVTHFPGRGLLIPTGVFRQIGLFDAKRFPHYAADYDFTHRAMRAGYRIFCNYDARLCIYRAASGSVQLRKRKSLKNYADHLWGIKGGGNLQVFALYAWQNCPARYRARYILQGCLQRIVGYWLKGDL